MKIITLLLGIILLSSCQPKNIEYTMVYKVYYTPSNVKTYTQKVVGTEKWGGIGVFSDRGTNYIQSSERWFGNSIVFETSAPIEVVSYTKKKLWE